MVETKSVAARGERLYEQGIRSLVDTEQNVGKLVSIDVESGMFEIADEDDVEPALRLQRGHSGTKIYTRRIGYNTAFALGGAIERSAS